jgi:hypothetical protein
VRTCFDNSSAHDLYVFTIPIQVFTLDRSRCSRCADLAFTFDRSECSPWTENPHPCAHFDPADAVTYYSILDPRIRSGPQTRQLTEEDGAWRSSTW